MSRETDTRNFHSHIHEKKISKENQQKQTGRERDRNVGAKFVWLLAMCVFVVRVITLTDTVRTHTSWYARKGFLGFLRRRSGSFGGGSAGKAGWLSLALTQSCAFSLSLCLEVAPSILIDFICAHVSERVELGGCTPVYKPFFVLLCLRH